MLIIALNLIDDPISVRQANFCLAKLFVGFNRGYRLVGEILTISVQKINLSELKCFNIKLVIKSTNIY